ncbi:MAG TPA: hypothetical protein VIG62_20810 [Blastocatellia bacterium]|jgi:hypothetical protein
MVMQIIGVLIVCIVAALLALTIAGVSLSVFEKFLKRAEEVKEEANGR